MLTIAPARHDILSGCLSQTSLIVLVVHMAGCLTESGRNESAHQPSGSRGNAVHLQKPEVYCMACRIQCDADNACKLTCSATATAFAAEEPRERAGVTYKPAGQTFAFTALHARVTDYTLACVVGYFASNRATGLSHCNSDSSLRGGPSQFAQLLAPCQRMRHMHNCTSPCLERL
jgi:hypothetical protein